MVNGTIIDALVFSLQVLTIGLFLPFIISSSSRRRNRKFSLALRASIISSQRCRNLDGTFLQYLHMLLFADVAKEFLFFLVLFFSFQTVLRHLLRSYPSHYELIFLLPSTSIPLCMTGSKVFGILCENWFATTPQAFFRYLSLREEKRQVPVNQIFVVRYALRASIFLEICGVARKDSVRPCFIVRNLYLL